MRPMVMALLLAVASPATTVAQAPPKTDSYLLLVAAAVSGYSAGGPVWVVVCDSAGQYKVIGAFSSEAEAKTAATAASQKRMVCNVEGPYTSTLYAGGDLTSMTYGGGCKKGPDSDCIGDSTAARSFIGPISSIVDVTLTYRFRDGRTPVSEQFDPRKVEAIFFTMPAVDRLLMPYFLRVYGASGALERRRVLLDRFRARDLR